MFIITFSCARFINKIFYFAKVYVFYLIAKAFVVNYSKTQCFSIFIGVLKPLPRTVLKHGFPLRVRKGSEYLLQIKVGRRPPYPILQYLNKLLCIRKFSCWRTEHREPVLLYNLWLISGRFRVICVLNKRAKLGM